MKRWWHKEEHMPNVGYDSTFDLGTLSAAGAFPNIIDLGKTNANQFAVDIFAPAAAAGGPFTVTVYGGDTDSAQANPVGTRAFTAAELNSRELCQVAISPNGYRYIKVSVAASTFTAGTLSAILNTYIGK
jgi:hypothetical protein